MLYQLGSVSDAILQLQVRSRTARTALHARSLLRSPAASPACQQAAPCVFFVPSCPRPPACLQDLEVSLRGYAEVHAALAAILYVERPALLEVAEQQWEIGQEFNKSFADPQWVADTKGWPPRLMAALDRFLKLQ